MKKTTRKTIQYSRNLSSSYETFPYKDEIDYKTYKLIMNTYHIQMVESMSKEGAVYQLPEGLGHMGCFQRSTYGRGVFDYQLYKEFKIKRYIKNRHTEGRAVVFVWDCSIPYRGVPMQFKSFYKWKPPRDAKRNLAKLIFGGLSVTIFNNLNE